MPTEAEIEAGERADAAREAAMKILALLKEHRMAIDHQAAQIRDLAGGYEQIIQATKTISLQPITKRIEKLEQHVVEYETKRFKIDADTKVDLKAQRRALDIEIDKLRGLVVSLNDDVTSFWRLGFLDRLAWIIGGARFYQKWADMTARWRQWWQQRWHRA